MNIRSRSACLPLALLAAMLASTCVGCASFGGNPFDLGANKKVPIDPAKMVTVEMQADSGENKVVQLPHEDTLLAQTALQKSGAIKKFRRMNVSLVRARPDGRGPHKMEVKYESESQRVRPDSDYALLPGDKLIAVEDVSTPVDDAMETLLGGFNLFSRKR